MTRQMENRIKLPIKRLNERLAEILSLFKNIDLSKNYATMSGIIPDRLHLCRACFRFIPA